MLGGIQRHLSSFNPIGTHRDTHANVGPSVQIAHFGLLAPRMPTLHRPFLRAHASASNSNHMGGSRGEWRVSHKSLTHTFGRLGPQ